jgi:hypothetical protein
MKLTDALQFRWGIIRRLPGLSARKRFGRTLLYYLVWRAECELERDLTLDQAVHLAYRFMTWQAANVPNETLIDEPSRQVSLYLTTEPWQYQLATMEPEQ